MSAALTAWRVAGRLLTDFEACELTQLSMGSRAYRDGGVLMPSEHHITEFHAWVTEHG
jgi:Rieske 2Fe-2S family protein